VVGSGIIVLAIPKLGLFNGIVRTNETAGTQREQQIQVHTYTIHYEKLGDRVTTVGTILSNEEVEIRSEISGRIERLSFKEGGSVKQGETLLKINDTELKAQLLRAESRQELADRQGERNRLLYEKNLISKEEYDNTVTNLNMAKAEAQLIKAQIYKTEIRAPFDGNIGLRYVSEGSYVTPTILITTLQDIGTVKIDFSIPEKYAGTVNVGDKITFTVQRTPRTFTGTIYAIQPKIEPSTRTLRVRAKSQNRDGVLLPGALASVNVFMEEKPVLMIPSYALVPELKGQKVFLLKSGKAEPQSVDIGIRTDERIEVTQGLHAGDTLIISALLQLKPGMIVRAVAEGTKQ